MKPVALRVALIWHDEVMQDLVLEKPAKITIGSAGKPTFIVPPVGLPKQFAIVRPGNRGYLLTLGDRMRGTICIDGKQQDVEHLVKKSATNGFHATPISGRDWGVVDLDESGAYKLYFQFVELEDAQPFFTKPVILAGSAGYLVSIAVLAGIFLLKGIKVDFLLLDSELLAKFAEGAFRGGLIASAALALGGFVWWVTRQDGESQASLGFSVMLHAALLFMTYQLYDGANPFVWPGPRALTGNYLVTRLEEPKPEPKVVATVGQVKTNEPAAAKTPEKPKNTATKNNEGASGGKGEKERARDKNAKDVPPVPQVALLDHSNQKVLDNFDNHNLATNLGKFAGIKADETRKGDLGFGIGTGTGVGSGHGTGTTRGSNKNGSGGGGFSDSDFVSNKGKIDTGTQRAGGGNCATPPCGTGAKPVQVSVGEADGDIEGLTAEEINRIVKARAGVFRACYQKELNRSPGLGGKLVIHFVIGGDGIVKNAKTGGGTSLHNDAVESCVSSNIMRLKFPAKGGLSNVNYPFVFQPGG